MFTCRYCGKSLISGTCTEAPASILGVHMPTSIRRGLFSDVHPGDVLGLNRHFAPARSFAQVRYWRPVVDSESLGLDRHRVTVAGIGTFPMTMTPGAPAVIHSPVA